MKLSFAEGFDIPPIIINPLFILALIALMLAGDYFLNHYIDKYLIQNHEPVTFLSDRQKVSLKPSEILYIESNDTEVWIYATMERKFRNKTPISQWENLLGKDFVRIHRSYLVNKTAISTVKGESVFVGSHQLPMSKKYSQKVTKFKTWGGSK
jgi:DNA-binding LytR/AlgR family response regulator